MFTADKQHFKTYIFLNRFRGFARLYLQRLTLKRDKSKMAANETCQILLGHIFGTKHGKSINETYFCMFSGTRNPLISLFNPQYAKKLRWLPY